MPDFTIRICGARGDLDDDRSLVVVDLDDRAEDAAGRHDLVADLDAR